MELNRRRFIQHVGALSLAGVGANRAQASADHGDAPDDGMGVLVDLTNCNGCRRCESACRQTAGFTALRDDELADHSVYATHRRPDPQSYTVVNAFVKGHGRPGEGAAEDPNTYVKANCLHCLRPACVSGCIVGALEREPGGAVLYNAAECMGCRYCMVACPFQIPAYEYANAFAPQVRKCTFCRDVGNPNRDGPPACVKMCPKECLTWGKRADLLVRAHAQIDAHPDRYLTHVYGEHEAGGTAWLYLSHVPFEKLGFLTVPREAAPVLAETIQHGVFKHFVPPVAWCGILALAMVMTRPDADAEGAARRGASTMTTLISPPPKLHRTHAAVVPCLNRATDLPPLISRGTLVLLALMGIGAVFGLYRFIFGLAASTNLDQQYPWGIWIVADVSFIALAAGGFTMAALVHVFHREHFHDLARPVLVFAMLGYTCACIALFADLGKYYNIWHPMLPSMWQGNSALFEVGMCVMCYLTVLYIEFAPVFCERFMANRQRPRLARACTLLHGAAEKIMPAFVVLGVGISCLHQSSLGHVMVLAPTKLHPLWYTPILALMFLVSAVAAGFPTAIVVSLLSSWALKRRQDMAMLGKLSRYVPIFVAVYLAFKFGDMIIRESYVYLWEGTRDAFFFWIEVLAGLVVPLVMLIQPRTRRSPRRLGIACGLVLFGIVLNRANVYIIGYHPPYTEKMYFPSLTEWAVTIGAVAALLFTWRAIATYFAVLGPERHGHRA